MIVEYFYQACSDKTDIPRLSFLTLSGIAAFVNPVSVQGLSILPAVAGAFLLSGIRDHNHCQPALNHSQIVIIPFLLELSTGFYIPGPTFAAGDKVI